MCVCLRVCMHVYVEKDNNSWACSWISSVLREKRRQIWQIEYGVLVYFALLKSIHLSSILSTVKSIDIGDVCLQACVYVYVALAVCDFHYGGFWRHFVAFQAKWKYVCNNDSTEHIHHEHTQIHFDIVVSVFLFLKSPFLWRIHTHPSESV